MALGWQTFVTVVAVTVCINLSVILLLREPQQRIVVVAAPTPTIDEQPPVDEADDEQLWDAASAAPVRTEDVVTRTPPTPPPASSPSRLLRSPSPTSRPHIPIRKPFYLVTSPESNGNRFLVKLLVSAGCYGQSGHEQPFDDRGRHAASLWPNRIRDRRYWSRGHEMAKCAAMHRSIPHNGVWPDLVALVKQIDTLGYEPRILVSFRPEDVARISQVTQKHVRTEEQAETNILRAQRHVIDALGTMPKVWVRFVLYEQLGHEHYLHWLFSEQMGLPLAANHPKFEDRDSKHFH